jgi:hypothetical protein
MEREFQYYWARVTEKQREEITLGGRRPLSDAVREEIISQGRRRLVITRTRTCRGKVMRLEEITKTSLVISLKNGEYWDRGEWDIAVSYTAHDGTVFNWQEPHNTFPSDELVATLTLLGGGRGEHT